jgi:hypothetical protein
MLASAGDLAGAPLQATLELPDSVRLAVQHNLRVLSPACQDLLTLASLLGREFRVEALTRASKVDPEEVLTLLDEAKAARIVETRADGPGRRRFVHALFGETLAGALGAATRSRLHRRTAEALASDPRAGEHAAEIAHHWMQAGPVGDPDEAVAWACRAGGAGAASPRARGGGAALPAGTRGARLGVASERRAAGRGAARPRGGVQARG